MSTIEQRIADRDARARAEVFPRFWEIVAAEADGAEVDLAEVERILQVMHFEPKLLQQFVAELKFVRETATAESPVIAAQAANDQAFARAQATSERVRALEAELLVAKQEALDAGWAAPAARQNLVAAQALRKATVERAVAASANLRRFGFAGELPDLEALLPAPKPPEMVRVRAKARCYCPDRGAGNRVVRELNDVFEIPLDDLPRYSDVVQPAEQPLRDGIGRLVDTSRLPQRESQPPPQRRESPVDIAQSRAGLIFPRESALTTAPSNSNDEEESHDDANGN